MISVKTTLIIIFVLSINYLYSQEVIASSTNYSKNENCSVFWSIGEVISESISNSNVILTQGFYQTRLSVTALNNFINPNFEISIFPNPANDYFKLKIKLNEGLNYQIINDRGIIVAKNAINQTETLIQVNQLVNGLYLLIIYKNNQMIKSYKIEKL